MKDSWKLRRSLQFAFGSSLSTVRPSSLFLAILPSADLTFPLTYDSVPKLERKRQCPPILWRNPRTISSNLDGNHSEFTRSSLPNSRSPPTPTFFNDENCPLFSILNRSFRTSTFLVIFKLEQQYPNINWNWIRERFKR